MEHSVSTGAATPPWHDIPSIARRALVSPATVKREIRSGRLKAFKVGRLTRVHVDDCDAWLRSRAVVQPVKPHLVGGGQ